jgi:glyoxylate reductase
MGRVLITRRLPEGGLEPLAGHELVGPDPDDRAMSHEELLEAAASVDGIVCLLTDRIDAAVLEAGRGRLLGVANVAVGYDNIDIEAARAHGIAVCNTPGVLDESTADLAFLLILAASRRSSEAEADLRRDRWKGWGINQYLGHDVHGATLGLVGYGRIGRAVARRAAGFGMRVLHHCRRPTGEDGYRGQLEALLEESDIVSLHIPGGEQTRHCIDARALARMRRGAVLIKTARGSVVDELALAVALEEGKLFAAGLDVYEREPAVHPRLLAAPGTVLLPHIGSASVATRTQMARLAAIGMRDLLAGLTPTNLVLDPAP